MRYLDDLDCLAAVDKYTILPRSAAKKERAALDRDQLSVSKSQSCSQDARPEGDSG